jgi:hypothetical protein
MDIRRHEKISAWSLLGGLQLLILGGLIVGGFSLLPPSMPPVAERLSMLDKTVALAAVVSAIDGADSGRALQPDDEQRATMFLQLLSQAAEMELLSLTLNPGPQAEALQSVDVTLQLAGDPFNLPIFLDGLQRQRAVNHLISLEGSGGLIGQFTLTVRYYRPIFQDNDWILQRLVHEEPEHADASHLLQQAAVLTIWRRFQWEERDLVATAAVLRSRVSRELAAPLMSVRAGGGRLAWDAEQGPRLL